LLAVFIVTAQQVVLSIETSKEKKGLSKNNENPEKISNNRVITSYDYRYNLYFN
jgi:hypothetical protein